MRPLVLSSALTAALVLISPAVSALSYEMPRDEQLLEQADGVAVFEVLQVAPAAPGDTETRYLVSWRRGIAGQATFGYEWLALPGAESGSHLYQVDGIPKLSRGEQWLLFYKRRVDGTLQPLHLTLGMFLLRADADRAVYWRTVDLEAGPTLKTNAEFAAPRDAKGFEQWLRERASGAKSAPDYLLDPKAERSSAKYSFAMFSFSPQRPARWFEFDSGGSVPVRAAAGGQANTASDEFAALNRAIAAWNDDPGSRVNMSYAGTGSSSADSAINITWNDPDNQISGSFVCGQGGVLGIGGSSATTSQSTTLGGLSWAKRVRGFVVIQDGAGCAMDGGSGENGAELLGHELGHVLALGHSCGDSTSGSCDTTAKSQAIMRATLQGGGRGAALGSDDRAGIAVPYPQAASGPRPSLVHRSGFE